MIQVTAPSNIAFIKYWGKSDTSKAWPANDSLSMTLKNCVTKTTVQYSDVNSLTFDRKAVQKNDPQFEKVFRYIQWITQEYSPNPEKPIAIKSENTFPSDCGIASSASGYAALGTALIALFTSSKSVEEIQGTIDKAIYENYVRLGSGSACRSLYGGFNHWKRSRAPEFQTIESIKPEWKLSDTVVLVDPSPKKISSSKAHEYTWSSPLFEKRLKDIPKRLEICRKALMEKDFSSLQRIIEKDALEMHAVSKTAKPSVVYMEKPSLDFIDQLKFWRKKEKIPVAFTVDAGPNIHLISPIDHQNKVNTWVKENFNYKTILDETGDGPIIEASNL